MDETAQLVRCEANFEQVLDDVLLRGEVKDPGNAILVSDEVWRGITKC